jgi:phage terminase Nu1 subunit (DNA packaging protein)
MPHLSQRKIAARLGCSHTYIQKLIARGTISAGALNEKGRIDPEVALSEILASVDDSISCITGAAAEWLTELREGKVPAAVKQIAKAPKKKPARKAAPKKPKVADEADPEDKQGQSGDQESIIEANRRDAIAKANMREIKEAEAKKLLVSARDVELEAFARARQLRDAILAIPDRIAPIIAAETDEHTVRQTIDTELRNVLRDLAKSEAADG